MAHSMDIAGVLQALSTLHGDIAEFINQHDINPLPNSQADKELRSFSSLNRGLSGAYSQGGVLIEVTADYLMGFAKTVTEPVQTIAPWTCIRSLIESCALACWLLDPGVDAKTRVQRNFAVRFEGLSQQLKYARAVADGSLEAKIKARIDNVEHDALGLGYPPVRDKKGNRIGIGEYMPPITDFIGDVLDKEATYRLFSAIAHAQSWALHQVSFQKVSTDNLQFAGAGDDATLHIFEKHLAPESFAILCFEGVDNFARSVWYKCQIFGWDLDQLARVLDKSFDSMNIQEKQRFWKHRDKTSS